MVLDHYFASFFPFPWPINYNITSRCVNFSTHWSTSWFWSKKNSFSCIHNVTHDYVLLASICINEQRITLIVIPRFDINPTSSRWRSQTVRDVPSSQSQTPVRAWYIEFLWTLIPWWYCCRLLSFLAMNLKLFTKAFTKLKTPQFLHGFQFLVLDTSVGHYCWLFGLICWMTPNNKVDYLVHTIQRILDFLQLWHTTMA